MTVSKDEVDANIKKRVLDSAQHLFTQGQDSSPNPEQLHDNDNARPTPVTSQNGDSGTANTSPSDDMTLHNAVTTIRHTIENIDQTILTERERKALLELNDSGRFKCNRLQCSKFSEGFPERDERERHISNHERPYKCSVPDCFASRVEYTSQRDLDNHYKRFLFGRLG